MHKLVLAFLLVIASAVTADTYASLTAANNYIFGITSDAIYKFNYADASPVCYQPHSTTDFYQYYRADPSGRYLFTPTWQPEGMHIRMIDTTTFEERIIDGNAADVLGVDDNYVYTQYYVPRGGVLIRQIKFTAAWNGVETENREITFPESSMVKLGNGVIIGRYRSPSNRYMIVSTDTMTSYEIDLTVATRVR
jgi:hypothetical protein